MTSAILTIFILVSFCSPRFACKIVFAHARDMLFDMPVSNHGARIRFIIHSKKINEKIDIVSPSIITGIKSPEYLKLNCRGKVPLLLTSDKYPIPESDCIAKYILDKYQNKPSFIPKHIMQRTLDDQICRFTDMYIGPVQGAMYKMPGTRFSTFGSNRIDAIHELKNQIQNIEGLLETFESIYPDLVGSYLCGDEISLSDVTLFTTMVFCVFMLPQFFGCEKEEFLGRRLLHWWNFMTNEVPEAIEVKNGIEIALNAWKSNGRWNPILDEIKTFS